jgi:hypothetical protein
MVDFKNYLKSKLSYNIIIIFVNRLNKCPITILIQDTIIVKELTPLFLLHVICYVSILNTIVLDQGP